MIQLAFDLPAKTVQQMAAERLARDVERRKNAYETKRYCERRAAALKGTRRAHA
jgi:hypothetical protein